MSNLLSFTILVAAIAQSACAQIENPVTFFRSLGQDAPVIVKWEADINGDGNNEIFLSRKDEYDQEVTADEPPSWFIFMAGAVANRYTQPTGIQEAGEDALGVGGLPMIDLKVCFVGVVTELGQRALLTQQIDNPRAGDPIARIYAYTIEGDHLKRTKLVEDNAMQSNAVFDKYLKDGQRTEVTLVVLDP